MAEIWKNVVGYEGIYQISSLGKLKSLPRNNWKTSRIKTGFIVNGYYVYDLYKNNKRKKFLAHRLIAEAFIPNPENKATVNHKNGIRMDNRVENLEWATRQEQTLHMINVLERGNTAILNRQKAFEIREFYHTGQYDRIQLGKIYGVSKSTIYSIIKEKTWKK